MNYPDDFEHYGFLSKQALNFDLTAPEEVELFREIREEVRVALAEAFSLRSSTTLETLTGLAMWIRAIESAQGAVLLAKGGMVGAAMPTARTAWECLFYATALWRRPELLIRLDEAHEHERLQQAEEMHKLGEAALNAELMASLLAVTTGPHQQARRKWSAWDAATAAGLDGFYQSDYRGLGLVGGHATARSLDRVFVEGQDVMMINPGPNWTDAKIVLVSMSRCLQTGTQRWRALEAGDADT